MGQLQRNLTMKINEDVSVRTETLRGQEFLVVPVVMLVEGTIQGALADKPELALASQFGQNTASWNGRPVVVNHPQRDNEYVSAGAPDIWETTVLGMLFNTQVQDQKLTSEIWLNKAWAEESGYDSTIAAPLAAGESMEVSTGFFCDLLQSTGVWEGDVYYGIWTNIVPDHLALLPNNTGACSVEMGCGCNRNEQSKFNSVSSIRIQTIGEITQQEIEMAAKIGSTVETKEIKPNTEKEPKVGFFQRALTALSAFAGEGVESSLTQQFMANLQGISDVDLRTALNMALAEDSPYCYIVAVFDDRVVYEAWDNDVGSYMMYSRAFTKQGDQIVLDSAITEVRPETTFIPIVESGDAMKENQTAAGDTVTTEQVVAQTTENTEVSASVTTETAVANTEKTETIQTISVQEKFGASEEEIRDALALRDNRKADLISQVLKAPANQFTEAELKEMNINQLDKIVAISANKVNFAGRGGSQPEREPTSGTVVPLVKAFSPGQK